MRNIEKFNHYLKTANKGLASANKKNPFWTKSDAMRLINITNANFNKAFANY